MQLQALMNVLEKLAPRALAEEWDNPGLLIEPEDTEITKVLVALDCTVPVAEEAARVGAQLVLTHHPLFFQPVRSIFYSRPDTAAAYALVRNGIGLFAAHTNLDSALHGVNDALAAAIGLTNVRGMCSPDLPLGEDTQDIGRLGELPAALSMQEFAAHVQEQLGTSVRIGGNRCAIVRKVAVIGGSGGSFLREVKEAGADVLLTGEVKHDQAIAAGVYGMGIMEAGHYETECVVLEPWIHSLQRELEELQYKVDFVLAESDHSWLAAP